MHRLSLWIVLLAACVPAACRRAPAPPPVIRMGYAPHDHHSPLFVAALRPDLFQERGLPYLRAVTPKQEYELLWQGRILARLVLSATPGGKELVRRLAEDQLDAALGGFPAMVQQIDQGAPLRILGPVMAGGSGLVVRPDLPARDWPEFVRLARSSPSPLRIGYRAEFAVQKLIVEGALARSEVPIREGLDAKGPGVVLVNLYEGSNLLPGLKSGLVDGFLGVQPFLALAEEREAGRLLSRLEELPSDLCDDEGCGITGTRCYQPCCALAARTALPRQSPEATQALLSVILEASRFIGEHPAEAADPVARWLGTSEAVERRSLPTIHFYTGRDASWDRGVALWIRAMVQRGAVKGAVARAWSAGAAERLLYGEPLAQDGN